MMCETAAMGSTVVMPEDLIARVMSEIAAMQLAGHSGNDIREREKVELRKRIHEQDRQIRKLCKEVAFLRHGFTRLPTTGEEAVGFRDWHVRDRSDMYSRRVHRCVLASNSAVMKVEILGQPSHSPYLFLPKTRFGIGSLIGGRQPDTDIYDAFIDYFYTASVSESNLQGMFADLLFLALQYDVADLRDDCLQCVQGNGSVILDQHKHLTAFLSLGLEFNSKPVITCALQFVKRHSTYLDSEDFKQLVQVFPHVDNMISQSVKSNSLND